MRFVDLDRRFAPWSKDEDINPDTLVHHLGDAHSLGRVDLLQRKRVVVLAEAGSGKSVEFNEWCARLQEQGEYSIISTLEKIGRNGFREAFEARQWRQFEEWKGSSKDLWLFLDSVDEAKKLRLRFGGILDKVADAIEGVEQRVHLLISGRYSDWEFKGDLGALLQIVPLPQPEDPVERMSLTEKIGVVFERDRSERKPEPETPLVVVMVGLDEARVEKFALSKGVVDGGRFLRELREQNLLRFARRPTDLGWLVEYWRTEGRFGSLLEMLEQSINERLLETDPDRQRGHALTLERSLAAMRRIGASLTLQRIDSIAVPDSEASLDHTGPIVACNLVELLPDWRADECLSLLSLPMFDAATGGYVRLHNDNEGEVRGYLTARWLQRLRLHDNCPWHTVRDLLFAETYDVEVVRPSMRSTAAWMSIFEPDVAEEVVRRDPGLLMSHGDPGSLRSETRRHAVDRLIEAIKEHEMLSAPNHDALKRFSNEDISDLIVSRWKEHRQYPAVRALLLLMIDLGALSRCSEVAREAAFGGFSDRQTQLFAGRALAAAGLEKDKRRYITHIIERAHSVSGVAMWDALDTFFPAYATPDQLLEIVDLGRSKDRHGGLTLDYYMRSLASRVECAADLRKLVEGLLDRLPTPDPDDIVNERMHELSHSLDVASAFRLMLCSLDEIPEEVLRAAAHLAKVRGYIADDPLETGPRLKDGMSASPARRRTAMWGLRTQLAEMKCTEIDRLRLLQIFGFDPQLRAEDLDWVLSDMAVTADVGSARFIADAAMNIWAVTGQDEETLARIRSAAAQSDASKEVVEDWITPRRLSVEEEAYERQSRARRRRTARQDEKVTREWAEFVGMLRADPEQLRHMPVPKNGAIDDRLINIWKLLRQAGSRRDKLEVRDFSPLVPILGSEVVAAARAAFAQYWRHGTPTLIHERRVEDKEIIYVADFIGLIGISQEAATRPQWAGSLSTHHARLAARYAMLELNGFPAWLNDVAKAHPRVVRDVLWACVNAELSTTNSDAFLARLQYAARANDAVTRAIAKPLLAWLKKNDAVPLRILEAILTILNRVGALSGVVSTLVLARLESSPTTLEKVTYLASAFVGNPTRATSALITFAAQLNAPERTALVEALLPRIVGGRRKEGTVAVDFLPFSSLVSLTELAFSAIHPEDDNRRPSGIAYRPDERDDAEMARGALFMMLAQTPGYATFAALRRLEELPEFGVSRQRLKELQRERAESDSEFAPWDSNDVPQFEGSFARIPSTSRDLQQVAMGKLAEIQHTVIHGDYNEWRVVQQLPAEVDVQNWFASALDKMSKGSYRVVRESHVAEEKEPDIRLLSTRTRAACPIEIKIATDWSIRELEAALSKQLCKQYLRHIDSQYGILLLVHQVKRPRGWRLERVYVSWLEVEERLRALAIKIAENGPGAPQAAIVVVEVSSARP